MTGFADLVTLLQPNKPSQGSSGTAFSWAFLLQKRSIEMRAIWVGLVGAMLAVGGAGAAGIGGEYKGKGQGWDLSAKFTPMGGGKYRAMLFTSTSNGCVGEIKEVGTLRGRVMEFGADSSADSDDFCPVKVTFSGRSIHLVETSPCKARGAMCTFNGALRKER